MCALLNYKRELFSLVFRLLLPAPHFLQTEFLSSVPFQWTGKTTADSGNGPRVEGETESEKASCIGQKLWSNTHTGQIPAVRNGRSTAIHSVCCYLKIVCIPYKHIVHLLDLLPASLVCTAMEMNENVVFKTKKIHFVF